MKKSPLAISAISLALFMQLGVGRPAAQPDFSSESTDMKSTGLIPRYPAGRRCSPLTSLYMSLIDVDGSKRDEPHTGVDGGRLRDPIFAPADGVVIAVWEADWGSGMEGALLIRHSKSDLGLQDGVEQYYSEFNHMRYAEIRSIAVGTKVKRGDWLGRVFWPGGDRRHPPEVHWEVWAIPDEAATTWEENDTGEKYWVNEAGRLLDPLYMLSLNASPGADGIVDIPAFDRRQDYSQFRGFTYILPCPEIKRRPGSLRNRQPR